MHSLTFPFSIDDVHEKDKEKSEKYDRLSFFDWKR